MLTSMRECPARGDLLDAARALVVDAAASRAVAVLAASGVRSIVLRGPALAALLYDDQSQRRYADVDLLVEPDLFAEAESALARHGFVESALEAALPARRPRHAHTWLAPSGGSVDLHRTLIGIGAAPAAAWRVLSSGTETMTLHDVAAEIPSLPSRALVVALHAAHHVDEPSQATNDLERALVRLPASAWREAARLARELQAVDAFAAGLALDPRGRAELDRLGLEPSAPAARSSVEGDRLFHVAQGIAWLAAKPGATAKIRFLLSRLTPSPRTMRRRSALARRGRVGLVLAYVLRWIDATRHLPTALAALRRTRR